MFQYHLPLFRPPSESRSLLIQVTLGCSHNKCTFCQMYQTKKYVERKKEEIYSDIEKLKKEYLESSKNIQKAFICDGDALNADTKLLIDVMGKIKKEFVNIRRIGIYATAKNVIMKTDDELKSLNEAGLDICYIGLESGSDEVLELIQKGNTKEEMIESCVRLKKSNIKISMIALLGVGGTKLSKIHCQETADIISKIVPDFFSFLTLTVVPHTAQEKLIKKNVITPLSHKELLMEMKEIISGIGGISKIIFRANHVSNSFPLGGVLPRDKRSLLDKVNDWINKCPEDTYPDMDYRNL